MTAELRAIVRRIGELRASGRPAVLATLVKTEGSSYRTLGTRMLIERDGTLTGFLSAGCLEADLAQRAEAVFQTGQPATVTYDTSAPGDIVWGLGLGCNGVLTVLLEPMDTPSVERALAAIAQCLETRSPGALAIVIATPPGSPIPLGCATVHSDSPSAGLPHGVLEDVRRSVGGTSVVRRYGVAEGELEILIESLRPPHSILIYGAGADVPALCQVAQQLGWHVTVADRRSDKTLRNAAPQADRVLSLDAAQLGEAFAQDPTAAVVIMSHNFLTDKEALRALLPLRPSYLGLLGPKQRKEQLLEALKCEGYTPSGEELRRLYTPVGLDIGAVSPQEIALATAAEILAVLNGRNGGSLRHRESPIHAP